MWITAAEARPGNQAVVHHVVLYACRPGIEAVATWPRCRPRGKMVTLYAPGMNPWAYPAGTAMKIEKGSTLIIQTHYTPNGTAQDDRSYVGLKLADLKTVKRQVRYGMVGQSRHSRFRPAPMITCWCRKKPFLRDALLLNLFPHMHYRGKSFRFEAEYPDGRREVLLDVPHYDFNWQLRYDLAEPKFMPKGSKLDLHGPLRQFGGQPAESRPDPDRPLRPADLGRDDGRLLQHDLGRRRGDRAQQGRRRRGAVAAELSWRPPVWPAPARAIPFSPFFAGRRISYWPPSPVLIAPVAAAGRRVASERSSSDAW